MALSYLTVLPPELKLVTYYHIELTDLLTLSHVSRLWRALVLGDRRWNAWFDMIIDPVSGHKARDFMLGLHVLNTISKRTVVNLCFSTECSICSKDTPNIFLPLLKRICDDCLDPEEHAVMALSAALTTFDLNEKEVKDIVILQSPKQVKLVSTLAVKNVAIEKFGSEAELETHFQTRKARSQQAYEARVAEYDAATNERNRLIANGDLAGADAVTLKNKKKIPKTRPMIPPILKPSYTPPSYQALAVMPTNFLVIKADNTIVAHALVRCEICVIISELCSTFKLYPGPMRPEALPDHEYEAHYAREDDSCQGSAAANASGMCDACMNRLAIDMKEERDELRAAAASAT
ncbi:hypothetical protein MVEN_00945500 [Mycena venus]|uniref:F-box domain-containing protein n=1 Tax=Mycena venus TaxID=2733690 RepID=A0A8H6Y896_9AGAR|nr:hypothetical protein MVEN_00945500 [Mycena venus]